MTVTMVVDRILCALLGHRPVRAGFGSDDDGVVWRFSIAVPAVHR